MRAIKLLNAPRAIKLLNAPRAIKLLYAPRAIKLKTLAEWSSFAIKQNQGALNGFKVHIRMKKYLKLLFLYSLMEGKGRG